MNALCTMRNRAIARVFIFFLLAMSPALGSSAPRLETLDTSAEQPYIINAYGVKKALYKNSYALIMTMSNYQHPDIWPNLVSTEKEGDDLSAALLKNGFKVRRVHDQPTNILEAEIRRFLGREAMTTQSRVIFFYSGHGHYDKETDKAYLIPTDGVLPSSEDFYTSSYSMDYLRTAADGIKATHALFLFDNCYSGVVLKSIGAGPLPRPWEGTPNFKALQETAQYPVRQFITAGGPTQTVPGSSIFLPGILQGLQGGASASGDGYVTGKELALFVTTFVLNEGVGKNKQIPSSAILFDVQGDMIFQYKDFDVLAPTTAPNKIAPNKPVQKASVKIVDKTNTEIDPSAVEQLETAKQKRRDDFAMCKNAKGYLPKNKCDELSKEFRDE